MRTSIWTGKKLEILEKYVRGEISSVEAAKLLKVSTSAVTSAAFRYRQKLGLPTKTTGKRKVKLPDPLERLVNAALEFAGERVTEELEALRKEVKALREERERLKKELAEASHNAREIEENYRRQMAAFLERKGVTGSTGD